MYGNTARPPNELLRWSLPRCVARTFRMIGNESFNTILPSWMLDSVSVARMSCGHDALSSASGWFFKRYSGWLLRNGEWWVDIGWCWVILTTAFLTIHTLENRNTGHHDFTLWWFLKMEVPPKSSNINMFDPCWGVSNFEKPPDDPLIKASEANPYRCTLGGLVEHGGPWDYGGCHLGAEHQLSFHIYLDDLRCI